MLSPNIKAKINSNELFTLGEMGISIKLGVQQVGLGHSLWRIFTTPPQEIQQSQKPIFLISGLSFAKL